MRHPLALVLVLAAATLGGCISSDDPGGGAGAGDDNDDPDGVRAAAGTYAPWTVSDWWRFAMDVRGFERYDETQLVHYEESGPEFVVGTPNDAEALYHAVFSINPILGRVHKHHLSPHERGAHAEMFPFENGMLRDGHVWTTVFYEKQLRLTSAYDPAIDTHLGERPGYRFHGRSADGTLTVDYTYVRDVKWFTELRVTDADGQLLHLELQDFGTGYSGNAHFIRAKDLFHDTLSGSGLTPVQGAFQVTQGHVDDHRVESFAVSADIRLESGISAALHILDPDGNTIYERQYDDPADGEFDIRQVWPTGSDTTHQPLNSRPQWQAGTYTVRLSMSGSASAEIHIVGTQDNSGAV